MSFLRRNKAPDDAQAVPVASNTPPPQPEAPRTNPGQRVANYARDSYNGLYKVVLAPNMPTWGTILLLLFGFLLGMFWAYSISPTEYFGGNPTRMNQAAQDQWVKMAAVGFDTGTRYDVAAAVELLNRVNDPLATIDRLLADPNTAASDRNALEQLRQAVAGVGLTGDPSPIRPSLFSQLLSWIVPILLILIVTPIVVLLWRMLIYPNIVAGLVDNIRAATNSEYREQRQRERASREAARVAAEAKRSMIVEADLELGDPVMKTLSLFSPNRRYDDSFEIERDYDGGSDFLGQCGATIPDILAGDPLAVEVWLFDMFSQQDVKKLFVTPQGMQDPGVRTRLEGIVENPATDIIGAAPGAILTIDTEKLRLQATMASMSLGDNGRFEEFQMRIASWQKDASFTTANAPASAVPMPPSPSPAYQQATYETPAPPSTSLGSLMGGQQQPSNVPAPPDDDPLYPSYQAPAQSSSPQSPFSMPPLSPTSGLPQAPLPPSYDDEDDDPFAGTGDFTPLPRN